MGKQKFLWLLKTLMQKQKRKITLDMWTLTGEATLIQYLKTYSSFPQWATSEGLRPQAGGEEDQAALLGMTGCFAAPSQIAEPPPPSDRRAYHHTEALMHH